MVREPKIMSCQYAAAVTRSALYTRLFVDCSRSIRARNGFLASPPCQLTAARPVSKRTMNFPPFSGYRVDISKDESPLVSHDNLYNGVDPGPFFSSHPVQYLLKELTKFDKEIVFRHRKTEANTVRARPKFQTGFINRFGKPKATLKAPEYVFMTDEDLENARKAAEAKGRRILQMPPIIKVHEDVGEVLEVDTALQGVEKYPIYFADISLDIADRDRLIWVRESDGTLRHAQHKERHRINSIYNPREGRTDRHPELFHRDSFQKCLDNCHYEFILDRACSQLEPDDSLFQSICSHVYEKIDEKMHYDALGSTRHYGGMAFYLCWHGRASKLVLHLLEGSLEDAAMAVRLHTLLHPQSKTAKEANNDATDRQLLETYTRHDSSDRGALQLALARHDERIRAEQQHQRATRDQLAA